MSSYVDLLVVDIVQCCSYKTFIWYNYKHTTYMQALYTHNDEAELRVQGSGQSWHPVVRGSQFLDSYPSGTGGA